jgi:hypothetical protein
MKTENRFAYMVLGTLALAACGGNGASGAMDGDAGSGGTSGGTGGASSSEGTTARGGAGNGGEASGGGGSGGDAVDGGIGDPDGSSEPDGAEPMDGGAEPDDLPDAADAAPPFQADVIGFAYASKPAAASPYSPSASYRFNASGGEVTIERNAVGAYTVEFEDLDPPIRHAQVTAYQHSGYCIVSKYAGTTATVRCYDPDGADADARFSFAAFGPATTSADVVAYAFAGNEDLEEYDANANHSYNPSEAAITARRSAVGTYSLEFAGLSLATGNVQVTAIDTNHHCNVQYWTGNTVDTRCYDETGDLADAKYAVMVIQHSDGPVRVLGYTRTTSSDEAEHDLTGLPTSFNATGGDIACERTDVGAYTVTFAGADFSTALPQVSPWFSNEVCGVSSWEASSVDVNCRNAAGDPADALFSVVVVE